MLQFNSVHAQPRKSKRAMLTAFDAPIKSTMPARNTLDYTDAKGVRRIRLHQTDILTIRPNGAFTIATGAWNTHTTRARLNDFLPKGWRVFTSKGRIHLTRIDDLPRVEIPFLQTISVSVDGAIKPDMKPGADARLQKQIDAYMTAWHAEGLPTADQAGGDPWIFTRGKIDRAIMLDWIKSKYVFRSLYFMAHQWAGLTDGDCAFYAHDCDRRGGRLEKIDSTRIRRFVRACLGLAV